MFRSRQRDHPGMVIDHLVLAVNWRRPELNAGHASASSASPARCSNAKCCVDEQLFNRLDLIAATMLAT